MIGAPGTAVDSRMDSAVLTGSSWTGVTGAGVHPWLGISCFICAAGLLFPFLDTKD